MGSAKTEYNRKWIIEKYGSLGAYDKIRRARNPESWLAKMRRKKGTPKELAKRAARRWVQHRIKKGVIVREPCVICGCVEVEAHHCDYNKRAEIMWLCGEHHRAWHRVFLAEQIISLTDELDVL